MCEYCDNKAVRLGGTDPEELKGVCLFMWNGKPSLNLTGWCYGSVGIPSVSVKINYCPFCGKRLRKELV